MTGDAARLRTAQRGTAEAPHASRKCRQGEPRSVVAAGVGLNVRNDAIRYPPATGTPAETNHSCDNPPNATPDCYRRPAAADCARPCGAGGGHTDGAGDGRAGGTGSDHANCAGGGRADGTSGRHADRASERCTSGASGEHPARAAHRITRTK